MIIKYAMGAMSLKLCHNCCRGHFASFFVLPSYNYHTVPPRPASTFLILHIMPSPISLNSAILHLKGSVATSLPETASEKYPREEQGVVRTRDILVPSQGGGDQSGVSIRSVSRWRAKSIRSASYPHSVLSPGKRKVDWWTSPLFLFAF